MSARADRIRRHLDAALGTKAPGIQYVAVTSAGVECEYARGLADIARQVPMTSATTMMAYSMSKTITAIAVLQLVEAGRVALEDPLVRYVDGSPYGPEVSVRQLLSHTSGIPNPIPLRWVHAAAVHDGFDDQGALRRVMREHPRLASPPGTRYRYSNIGYWLLGQVIARASGESFTAYVDTHIVRPLGIPSAELGFSIGAADVHASGYLERYSIMNLLKGFLIDRALIGGKRDRWVEILPHYVNGAAFGGLVGTARAFGRLLQDQLSERSVLIGTAGRRLLYDPHHAVPALSVPMTLGWHVDHTARKTFFFKEGGGGGFHCLMRLYPDAGLGTVVMTNATASPVRQLVNRDLE